MQKMIAYIAGNEIVFAFKNLFAANVKDDITDLHD